MRKRFLVAALLLGFGSGSVGGVETDSYDAKGKRDPFIPLVREGRLVSATAGEVGDFSNPTLAGILWDPHGNSIALINDMEVKVGDILGEYEVTDIRPDAVVLMRQGKPLVLQLSFEQTPADEAPSTSTQKEKRKEKRR